MHDITPLKLAQKVRKSVLKNIFFILKEQHLLNNIRKCPSLHVIMPAYIKTNVVTLDKSLNRYFLQTAYT